VNAVAPEPLEGFESKLTQMFPIVGADHELIRFSRQHFPDMVENSGGIPTDVSPSTFL